MKVRLLTEKAVGGRYGIWELAQVSITVSVRIEGMGEKSV